MSLYLLIKVYLLELHLVCMSKWNSCLSEKWELSELQADSWLSWSCCNRRWWKPLEAGNKTILPFTRQHS